MIELSPAQARRVALASQGLRRHAPFGRGEVGARRCLEHLGYVQIDTISVVERAHHHVLRTRVPDYRPDMLDSMQEHGSAFEYWSHAAAYLPMADHRFTLRRKDAAAERDPAWFPRNPKVMKAVLKRIRDEGPLMARDFKPEGKRGSGPWFDWKPAKIALERLFHEGELMIRCRKGFQKVYDLTERVLPPGWTETRPDRHEQDEHFVLSTLRPHGLVTIKDCCHLWSNMRGRVAAVLERLVAEGRAHPCRIRGCEEPHWIAADGTDLVDARFSPRARILSPFDNAVIRRDRLMRLFDYEYQIECYTPEKKRRWGTSAFLFSWGIASWDGPTARPSDARGSSS